jgi:hypothetical protein
VKESYPQDCSRVEQCFVPHATVQKMLGVAGLVGRAAMFFIFRQKLNFEMKTMWISS